MKADNSTKKSKRIIKKGSSSEVLDKFNMNVAGLDIGSREHYVAVSEEKDAENVRSFGCTTPELHRMAKWLKECEVTSVAMESTGVYWIPAYQVLESYGFELFLVNAHQVKNAPGRKSDVLDCQWIRQLHSYGLLRKSFIPEQEISTIRSYWRHRCSLVEGCGRQIHLMQKSLEQMNIQLHKALSDVSGLSGMKIIRAIISGERDADKLLSLAHGSVKASQDQLREALTGNYRSEHVFVLKQALEFYDFSQSKLQDCDQELSALLKQFDDKIEPSKRRPASKSKRRKNQPYFDLAQELHRIVGVDLVKIAGIDAMTAFTVISECGTDLKEFPTEKQFSSWLGVCPGSHKTGGKQKSGKTRRVQNRASHALRLAAQSLHSSQTALGAFYRRMRARLGAPKAITATAHKLARIIYRLIKFGEEYADKGVEYYENQYRQRVIANLQRQAKKFGFQLSPASEQQ